MTHHRLQWTVSWVFVCGVACGCTASSAYKPRRAGYAYLVAEKGTLTYRKDNATARVMSDDAKELLSCSPQATAQVAVAQHHASSAATLNTVGVLFGLVGAFLTAPISAKHMGDAQAASIDALVAHNNASACVKPRGAAAERAQSRPSVKAPATVPAQKRSEPGSPAVQAPSASTAAADPSIVSGPATDAPVVDSAAETVPEHPPQAGGEVH